ncbi:hypothetical protein ACFVWN_32060 [Nocardiopsis flavescens]|uniref:Uncharacterized protein n=1 Tax=Nocardiopsis flavescens TaxID=758803 RepID=A0A1M6QYY1_9ACTN|nr:hypothetical protein [Nocardiopsis flavescens]SHK25366.1 hypothetical protein SAMN05421803_11683 [Nocardiopsis flavescens]
MKEAVERLYAVFARHRLSARINGCPHCVTDEDQRMLRGSPLRELGEGDLRRFVAKALTTWGGVDDLRHFLPRILDLALPGDGFIDIDTVAAKLDLARWGEWPADERAAVRACFAALWLRTLDREPEERPAVLLLDTLATAFDDLAPFLDTWTERLRNWGSHPRALRQFADTAGTVVATSPTVRHPQVVMWLLDLIPLLETLFKELEDADTGLAESVLDTHDQLVLLRAAVAR